MRIDIWSDIACPFCYIGKRHLEAALAATGLEAEVVWRSFELDPTPGPRAERDVVAVLMAKYRQSRPQVEAMMERVAAMGALAGLQLRLKDSVRASTFDAHRLLHLAAAEGRQGDAKERLLAAYFTEGADLGDRETLLRLAADLGLSVQAAAAVLDSDAYADAVRADEQMAHQIGVQGVPFFVFDERYAISGAQPVAVFQQALERCRADAATLTAAVPADAACTPDGCEV